MFYERSPESALRFGDVVKGFVLTCSDIDSPLVFGVEHDYKVKVSYPAFSVILSPCCSIGNKTITLAPIQRIPPSFLKNPYWVEDFARVNRPMALEKAVPPETWAKMPPEERQRRRDSWHEDSYVFSGYFVYAPHDLLPKYTLKDKNVEMSVGYYMIDFGGIHKVNCSKVLNPTQSPLDAKLLQLSIQTRSELRTKLAKYFARVPQEDEV